jgi:hypothetical protein
MTPGKNPKFFAAIAFSLIRSLTAHAQIPEKDVRTTHAEVMVVPAVLYNAMSAGYSIQDGNTEQVFNAGVYYLMTAYDNAVSSVYRYNRNHGHYIGNRVATYLPLWTSFRYTRYSGNSESGSAPFDLAGISIGSGYGMKIHLRKEHKIRLELGAGITANLYMVQGRGYSEYSFYDMVNRKFMPALRFTTRYMIPLRR